MGQLKKSMASEVVKWELREPFLTWVFSQKVYAKKLDNKQEITVNIALVAKIILWTDCKLVIEFFNTMEIINFILKSP